MSTTRFESWPCQLCGYVMDAVEEGSTLIDKDAVSRPPEEGDWTFCFNCGELYILHGWFWCKPELHERRHMPAELQRHLRIMLRAKAVILDRDLALEQKLGEQK